MMRYRILMLTLTVLSVFALKAQTFDVDTILYNGDPTKFINIVFMGDGYTASQQTDFIADVTSSSNYLFNQAPWKQYKGCFNVFAIKVISLESGAKHPGTANDCSSASVPVSNPNNYFQSSFDNYGIHRLIIAQNSNLVYSVLAANFPNYDQALILVNSPYYGGSGGDYATLTTDAISNEVTVHELGHSFAGLADEYYAGDMYFAEKPNMTQESNSTLVKWKNWVGSSGVGVNAYCCGGESASWFKPHTNCKMEYLGFPYCKVCSQTIIEKIHDLASPIVSYSPINLSVQSSDQFVDFELTEVMEILPNTLKTNWKVDGISVASNVTLLHLDQTLLANGNHNVSVSVEDTTSLLRVDNHISVHLSTIIWNLNKSSAGFNVLSKENEINLSMYPNPSNGQMNLSMNLEKSSDVTLQLMTSEGKVLETYFTNKLIESPFSMEINVSQLSSGSYKMLFSIDGIQHIESFVKE